MANGHKSNGATTERGRLTIIGANTTNGSRCFEAWLPGIETQEEWESHLAGIRSSLSPVDHLESELAYKVALTLQQWHRLDRYERVATLQAMEEAAQEPFGGDEAKTVMEAGVQALKERSALASRLIELATACPSMEPCTLIAPSEGRLLLCAAFAGELKKKASLEEPSFEEPPHWTWSAVQEGLSELAAAVGKSVERILLAVCRQASEQREQTETALKAGVPKLELALVQHGTALTNEYHGKVLGRLTKLLGLYGQAQAARLGLISRSARINWGIMSRLSWRPPLRPPRENGWHGGPPKTMAHVPLNLRKPIPAGRCLRVPPEG
jgi:hypothetical protein